MDAKKKEIIKITAAIAGVLILMTIILIAKLNYSDEMKEKNREEEERLLELELAKKVELEIDKVSEEKVDDYTLNRYKAIIKNGTDDKIKFWRVIIEVTDDAEIVDYTDAIIKQRKNTITATYKAYNGLIKAGKETSFEFTLKANGNMPIVSYEVTLDKTIENNDEAVEEQNENAKAITDYEEEKIDEEDNKEDNKEE